MTQKASPPLLEIQERRAQHRRHKRQQRHMDRRPRARATGNLAVRRSQELAETSCVPQPRFNVHMWPVQGKGQITRTC